MLIKTVLFLSLLVGSISAGENYSKEGKKVYDKLCISCHQLTIPAEKGPSLQMIANRLKMMTKTKKMSADFQRGVVLGYIRNYTLYPKLMRGAAQGLLFSQYKDMPSIKDKITRAELNAAAIWLYDNFVLTEPKEFKEMAHELKKVQKEKAPIEKEENILYIFTLQDIIVVTGLIFIALVLNFFTSRKEDEIKIQKKENQDKKVDEDVEN